MDKLDRKNELFTKLNSENPEWWQILKQDKDIYIEIRKDNYIDIYYNGGGIIKELRCKNHQYSASIHFKYLLPSENEYIKYDFSEGNISLSKNQIKLIDFRQYDENSLQAIKSNIRTYYNAKTEKGIQAGFINKSKYFIDSEFAFNYEEKLRIDLIWLDIDLKKIVFVELKKQDDSRLYSEEIALQLKKYHSFINTYSSELLAYYKELFHVKKSLRILSPELDKLESIDNFTIEEKPLLIFGDCEQKWIDKNSPQIDEKIKTIAYGAYYSGKPNSSCNLNQKRSKNRHVF